MPEQMSEREKMLAQMPYFALDSELQAMQAQARKRLKAYCALERDDMAVLTASLRALVGRMGQRALIVPPFHVDFGVHIHLGEFVFINSGATILDCNYVTFGERVVVGPNAQFLAAGHPIKSSERIIPWVDGPLPYQAVTIAKPITIGDDCWIGAGVIVLGGVSIGNGTTIGAGSVVTKDIPAGVVAAGNPCRVIREIDA